MRARGLFVTGTDTGIGKTVVSLAIMKKLIRQGFRVAGMKPVASGCEMTADGLRNDDAIRLHNAANVETDYKTVNPYAFEPPIAPHLAAEESGMDIDLAIIASNFSKLSESADWVVVEGVGGWLVPLGPSASVADLVRILELPVILVVGIRLGCLNHALLSARAIQQGGAPLVGWVANICDGAAAGIEASIRTLQDRLSVPLLTTIPHHEAIGTADIRVEFEPTAIAS